MSDHPAHPQEPLELRPDQGRTLQMLFLALAGGGAALSIVAFMVESSRRQFFFSYLVAFVFVMQIALGSLFWVILHHLLDAGWSVVVRRIAENFASGLMFLGILVLPILLGLGTLYGWTQPQTDEHHKHLLEGKAPFLNVPFFIVRTLGYFAIWAWLAWRFTGWSRQQDESKDVNLTLKMQGLSAPAMILLAFSAAFAGIDWIMSLDWTWFSTMFGVYFWAGSMLSSMCAVSVVVCLLRNNGILSKSITAEHLHDLGKLTFGFTIFWAYITFSQYFLTWYADIPEETSWFSSRRWVGHGEDVHLGSWHWVGVMIVVGHVIVPFLFLMRRAAKRNPLVLGSVAAWVLVIHVLELHYQIVPVSQPKNEQQFSPSWIDLATLAFTVGVFGFLTLRAFKEKALLPKGDPRLSESLAFQNF